MPRPLSNEFRRRFVDAFDRIGKCRYGPSPEGKAPFGHWNASALAAAHWIVGSPINGNAFLDALRRIRFGS